LSDIDETDKKGLNIDYGVKINKVNNPELAQYASQLEGGIILAIDGKKATDISVVSNYLNTKQSVRAQYKIMTLNGQVFSVIF
jgi:S1-C subfamily serine protease